MLSRIVKWLSFVFFLVVLPVYLLFFFIIGYYQTAESRYIQDLHEQMSWDIETISLIQSDKNYFHSVFYNKFCKTDIEYRSKNDLVENIEDFRKLFGNKIKFITWDSKGNLLADLTDEQGYRYVLRVIHNVLQELRKGKENGIKEVSDLDYVIDNMNIIQAYLGQYIISDDLFDPLKDDHFGKAIITGNNEDRKLVWYYPGENFTVLCKIDESITDINWGLKRVLDSFNQRSSIIKAGFIDPISLRHYGMPANSRDTTELKIEAMSFFRHYQDFRETDSYIIQFYQAAPEIIIFAYIHNSHILNSRKMAIKLLTQIIKWLFIICFILYCYFLRFPSLNMSIKYKMIFLFLSVNILPLAIGGSIGYEFFRNTRENIIEQLHNESIEILREFDNRYSEIASEIAFELNAFIDKYNNLYGSEPWPENVIEKLRVLISELEPDEAGIADKNKEIAYYVSNTDIPAFELALELFSPAISFFNSNKSLKSIQFESVTALVLELDLAYRMFLTYSGEFSIQNPGSGDRLIFHQLLGATKDYSSWGILLVSWLPDNFKNTFLPQHLLRTQRQISPRKIEVMDINTELMYSGTDYNNLLINHLLRRTNSKKILTRNNLTIKGNNYLFSAIAAKEIPSSVLSVFYPVHLIEQEINKYKLIIFVIISLAFFSLYCIIRPVSTSMILPVKKLIDGLDNLGKSNYNYRIEWESSDEFGDLVSAFNITMKDLKQLSVANTVQTALLPDPFFSCSNINLYAKTVFMTKMGGDYFDYYELSNNRILIFFGDVSGHGIPAAIFMAMTKASVASTIANSYSGPEDVINKAASVFDDMKKRKYRRMMTCLAIELNCDTGQYIIANAGHCFPAIIKNGAEQSSFLDLNGMPLGTSRKNGHPEVCGKLEPGEYMVLYTDGMIEATNENNEPIGYGGFLDILKSCKNRDLKKYLEQIYEACNDWCEDADDDLTVMIIRKDDKNE